MDAGWVMIIMMVLMVCVIMPELVIIVMCASPLWVPMVMLSMMPQIAKDMDDVTNYRCSSEQLLMVKVEAKSCLSSGGSMCFEQAKKSLCSNIHR